MSSIFITLVVEDFLSEMVARKLLEQTGKNYCVTHCLRKGGSGYLKSKINAFNQAAIVSPFFVLTDQDSGCPPDKITQWLERDCHPNLIFRIAVMEVESWVMGHREAFANFLSISPNNIPQDMDTVENPKQLLVSLARRSRSQRLRMDLAPAPGSTSTQGPDYNNRLAQFVQNHWNVRHAQQNSESLRRAFLHLQVFQPA